MGSREASRRARSEPLADELDAAPQPIVVVRGCLVRVRLNVDDDQVHGLAEVIPEARGPAGDRLLGGIRAGQQVGGGLASEVLLDLGGGPFLRELERDAGRRDVDERTVDRTEVGIR